MGETCKPFYPLYVLVILMQATQVSADITIGNAPKQTVYITPKFTIGSHTFFGTSVPLISGASTGQHIQSSGFVFNNDIKKGDAISVDLQYNNIVGTGAVDYPSGNNIVPVTV